MLFRKTIFLILHTNTVTQAQICEYRKGGNTFYLNCEKENLITFLISIFNHTYSFTKKFKTNEEFH